MAEQKAHKSEDNTQAVGIQLRTRVVREAQRATWFVVNESHDELTSLPLELAKGEEVRRAEANGELASFETNAENTQVWVEPRRALRPGAGTIVVLHFR